MNECAYCGSLTNKITKEHVISKSFLKAFYLEGDGYANAYEKNTKNFLTTLDVCDVCNNEKLSELDRCFLDFYSKIDQNKRIKCNQKIVFNYDYEKLAKWLLKTLYNSERKNGYSDIPKFLNKYAEYILSKNDNFDFLILIEFLHDHVETTDAVILRDGIKRGQLKIGNLIQSFSSNIFVKYFISGNICFYILFPIKNECTMGEMHEFHKKLRIQLNEENIYKLCNEKSKIRIKASSRTIVDFICNTYEGTSSAIQRYYNK